MTSSNSQLYRWERISKPRVYSRSQRVTSDADIQDWIRTVENASEKAAASAFGRKCDVPAPRHRIKADVQARVEDAQLHEAAYAEAQDLLNQWVNEKVKLDADVDFSEESWNKKTQADIKREWDQLLSNDVDLEIDELINTQRSSEYSEKLSARSKDPYSVLKRDPDDLVAEVLDRMYNTDVIEARFTRDLGLDNDVSKYPDPRTKMAVRHQQVKENREKRLRDKERKLRDLQAKKDANFKARQMVMKEEKFKETRKKKEEQEIQMEMARIRKEMEEERKKQEEERSRMKKEQEEMDRKTKDEYERQIVQEEKQRRKADYLTEERRKQILQKMQEIENRRAVENLKLKQKYFSAWYNLVIDKRLKTGKAKAMRDWRMLRRTFNAWKAHVREKRLSREAWAHEEGLKQFNRKANVAEEFWRHTLLRKCITAWQLFVSQQQAQRDINKEQEVTKNKMAAFLQAAASGKLRSARDESQSTERSTLTSVSQKVQGMFAIRDGQQSSASPDTTTRSSKSTAPPRQSHKPGKPTDAWLITRKDIQVTQKEIDSMHKNRSQGQNSAVCTCDNEAGSDSKDMSPCAKCQDSKAERAKQKPWQKAPFYVSNFEHRHAAQQKILEMQQKQIKEQQKLIEELQYLQKQQMLQQQLLQQESSKLSLNKGGSSQGVDTIHKTLAHLQAHISKLQHQLTSSYETKFENGKNIVHDIQVTDIENDGEPQSDGVLATDSLKLDLSHVVDEPCARRVSEKTGIVSQGGEEMQTKFGQTKVIARPPNSQQLSVRSDASSNVPTKPTTSVRTGGSRHENFLKSMEERAKERERIKKEREEKKKREEEERMAELFAREEEMRKQEGEEKARRAEAYREKKRAEKQKEKEKQRLMERMKVLNEQATEHYRRSLLKWRGIYAFTKLVAMSRENDRRAEDHCRKSLMRKAFVLWRDVVKAEVEERIKMADEFNNYLVVKTCFRNWTKYKEALSIQMKKARRHHENMVKMKVLRIWADFAAEEKVSMWHKERLAREHNLNRIRKKYFQMLRKFPVLRKEQEARELRREEMRKKVASMLSDYDGLSKSQSQDF